MKEDLGALSKESVVFTFGELKSFSMFSVQCFSLSVSFKAQTFAPLPHLPKYMFIHIMYHYVKLTNRCTIIIGYCCWGVDSNVAVRNAVVDRPHFRCK